MKGVILAGGKGVRLGPLTTAMNKHLLGVFDRPMILYPIETLKAIGVTDILVVSSKDRLGAFAEFLGDGSGYGVEITYRAQMEAAGIADGLSLARDFAKGERVALILGDNIFENERLPVDDIERWKENGDHALIILKRVAEPKRFGVPEIQDGKIVRIIEKPEQPPSDFAVTGLYCYPSDVFDVVSKLTPSARGELEITDVNNFYINGNRCRYAAMTGFWVDAGTHESLIAAALWAAERQGLSTADLAPKEKPQLTFTVGIPTYYGGMSLIRAVQSLRASEDVPKDFRLIVYVDGNPLAPEIEARLEELGVHVILARKRSGQVAGLNRMVQMAPTDLVVFAQDDVICESGALRKLIAAFEQDPQATMVNANVMPMKAETFFERVQEVGQRVVKRIIRAWHGYDNYLSANGRCSAFRTSWIKQIVIPEALVNSDAYLYFENKFRGGKFSYAPGAIVYDRSPLRLQEYIRQTKKYQASAKELANYFPNVLTDEYQVPAGTRIRAYLAEFVRHPLLAACYAVLYIYGRLTPNPTTLSRFWETDISTKRA